MFALTHDSLQAIPATASSVQNNNATGEGMSAKALAEFLSPQV
jgi:hypothetical protein